MNSNMSSEHCCRTFNLVLSIIFFTLLCGTIFYVSLYGVLDIDPYTRYTKTIVNGHFISNECSVQYEQKRDGKITKLNICDSIIEYVFKNNSHQCEYIWDKETEHRDISKDIHVLAYYYESQPDNCYLQSDLSWFNAFGLFCLCIITGSTLLMIWMQILVGTFVKLYNFTTKKCTDYQSPTSVDGHTYSFEMT